jgi:copper homeostasis protein
MVREQANFSVINNSEITDLREILVSLASMKIDGVVLGFVQKGIIDTRIISALLHGHDQLKVTFHRAFEATNDPLESIRALQNFPQIDKILTNGGDTNWGAGSWEQRIERIQSWQQIAKPIDILVGGEVDCNSLKLLRKTEIREFHVGRSVRTPETTSGKIDTSKIEKMRFILD